MVANVLVHTPSRVLTLQKLPKQMVSIFGFLLSLMNLLLHVHEIIWADEFLRSDCTHLMFLDADINFNPKDIFTLLALG